MRNAIIIFILAVAVLGCQEQKSELQLLTDKIETLEKELFAVKDKGEVNEAKAKELMTLYTGFLENNPTHERVAELTFKAGELSMGLEAYEQSIQFFDRIVKNHRDYDKAAEATYLVAFVYDEYLNEKGKASEMYSRMIELFPNHKLAADAQASMQLLNMSDEEILKMLEEKNS